MVTLRHSAASGIGRPGWLAGCALSVAVAVLVVGFSPRAACAGCGDYVIVGDGHPAADGHGPSTLDEIPERPGEPCRGPACRGSRPTDPLPVPAPGPVTRTLDPPFTAEPDDADPADPLAGRTVDLLPRGREGHQIRIERPPKS